MSGPLVRLVCKEVVPDVRTVPDPGNEMCLTLIGVLIGIHDIVPIPRQ